MTDFKSSETAKNLMRAFAGESQARNRYTFAAGLAKEQKMPMVEWYSGTRLTRKRSTQRFSMII